MGLGPPPRLTHQQLTESATACPPRVAWHILPLHSTKVMCEGREKRQGALDCPLAMSRGSGAALALRSRPQILTPHKNQALESIFYPPKAQIKPLEAYSILPRPRGLHPVDALTRTPWRNAIQKRAEAATTIWLKPSTDQTRHIVSEGVSTLLHRLGGYYWVS
jgi:hypothetical protein